MDKEIIDQVRDALSTSERMIPQKEKQRIENAIIDIHDKGSSIVDALNIPQASVEGLYSFAHHFYQLGKYKNAVAIFQVLHAIVPDKPLYQFCLAASLEGNKEYWEAITNYLEYIVLEQTDVVAFYSLSKCYMKVDQPYAAVGPLKMSMDLAKDKPEFKELLDHAQEDYKKLVKRLKKEPMEEGKPS